MRRRAAFLVSIVTLGRPLVLYFGFWPTLPLLSTATGMLTIFEFNRSLYLLLSSCPLLATLSSNHRDTFLLPSFRLNESHTHTHTHTKVTR